MYFLAIGLVSSDEIVKLREYRAANPSAEPPKFDDPGFRALVEENVKNTVTRIAQGPVMTDVSSPFLSAHFPTSIQSYPGDFLASLSPPRSMIPPAYMVPCYLPLTISTGKRFWRDRRTAHTRLAPLNPVLLSSLSIFMVSDRRWSSSFRQNA